MPSLEDESGIDKAAAPQPDSVSLRIDSSSDDAAIATQPKLRGMSPKFSDKSDSDTSDTFGNASGQPTE